ncbi:MAG: cytochrome C oxidase subunit IV family protein [Gemmatimonadota bacterium]
MEATAMQGSTQAFSVRVYVLVWLGLLLIVGVEVALAFAHPAVSVLVPALLALALLEAGIAVWYFMHLKFERRILLWSIVLLIAIMLMMNQFWFDAVRLRTMHH